VFHFPTGYLIFDKPPALKADEVFAEDELLNESLSNLALISLMFYFILENDPSMRRF